MGAVSGREGGAGDAGGGVGPGGTAACGASGRRK